MAPSQSRSPLAQQGFYDCRRKGDIGRANLPIALIVASARGSSEYSASLEQRHAARRPARTDLAACATSTASPRANRPFATCDLAGAMRDLTGNMPMLSGVFPDYSAPIVRNASDGVRELAMARWGIPSPVFAFRGRNSDPGRH